MSPKIQKNSRAQEVGDVEISEDKTQTRRTTLYDAVAGRHIPFHNVYDHESESECRTGWI